MGYVYVELELMFLLAKFPVALGEHGEFKAPTDQEHDASESAAVVAAKLLSYARLALNLDTVLTEYSAQFLVDNACPNKVDGSRCRNLTVKDCLRFAMEKGIPRADQWVHLGCMFKPSPSAYNPPLVSMKGELIEMMNKDEALKLLQQLQQPVGARLHVFSPQIDDLVGDKTIIRPPGDISRYVGLRDVIIGGVEGEMVAKVMVFYKKKLSCIKVSLVTMLDDRLVGNWDKANLDAVLSQLRDGGPAVDLAAPKMVPLLSDFCVPRLSIE